MKARTWIAAALVATSCAGVGAGGKTADKPKPAAPVEAGQAEAIFASGCFWCSESDFEKVPGVIDAVSGYAAGDMDQPTYSLVGTGVTGHTEALRVIYDPELVTYDALLDYFWHHVDPFDGDGQFCDRGTQYRPAILPVNDVQRAAATESTKKIEALFKKKVAVKIEDPGTFWVAEEYHQDFYKKNPGHYLRYRTGCRRDARVKAVWKGIDQAAAGAAGAEGHRRAAAGAAGAEGH